MTEVVQQIRRVLSPENCCYILISLGVAALLPIYTFLSEAWIIWGVFKFISIFLRARQKTKFAWLIVVLIAAQAMLYGIISFDYMHFDPDNQTHIGRDSWVSNTRTAALILSAVTLPSTMGYVLYDFVKPTRKMLSYKLLAFALSLVVNIVIVGLTLTQLNYILWLHDRPAQCTDAKPHNCVKRVVNCVRHGGTNVMAEACGANDEWQP